MKTKRKAMSAFWDTSAVVPLRGGGRLWRGWSVTAGVLRQERRGMMPSDKVRSLTGGDGFRFLAQPAFGLIHSPAIIFDGECRFRPPPPESPAGIT